MFLSKAAQGDRAAATLAGEAWLAHFANENVDYQQLLISAQSGNRQEANRIAAIFDQNKFGDQGLLDLLYQCMCGAPWELSATPNFAASYKESGLGWPPVSPITFPLKDW
jgi:hypothetical protein